MLQADHQGAQPGPQRGGLAREDPGAFSKPDEDAITGVGTLEAVDCGEGEGVVTGRYVAGSSIGRFQLQPCGGSADFTGTYGGVSYCVNGK